MARVVEFATSYYDARARFLAALDAYEAASGRRFLRERHVVDAGAELSIDTAELRPERTERLYLVVSGIHGIEGYAGNAIQRALLQELLPRFERERTGVLFVHALNPFGMLHNRRVNARNVDLNRNFAAEGQALYASDSSGYQLIASTLAPAQPYDARILTHLRYAAELMLAVQRHGFSTLRQATLAGQYVAPDGIFFGGAEPQLETRFFQRVFGEVCTRYTEILLTDLHTGYGERGHAYPLFGRADSDEMREFTGQGVRDARGKNQSYDARGDLVGYCYATAKAKNPSGVCNGVVVEIGTHGLGALAQAEDLRTVVRENQVALHGARMPRVAAAVAQSFQALFNPPDPDWQRRAIDAALERIESLLVRRGFFASGP